LKEISKEEKNRTIAIDFDGVIHKYSRGWQGLYNAYDVPNDYAIQSIKLLKKRGFKLVVFSSRDIETIKKWLVKYNLYEYFDEITNTKIPAKVYIDDKCYRFLNWEQTMEELFNENINSDGG
jgi:hypothetical protein